MRFGECYRFDFAVLCEVNRQIVRLMINDFKAYFYFYSNEETTDLKRKTLKITATNHGYLINEIVEYKLNLTEPFN